ncbi:Kinase protein [Thalictrum thalictroides]|uniref:non-specific serine/threonine protein kinase n=1 Tax=Thalictrum thalictroides TaxID=46969 RepID=A0A7J6WYN4_THATH|nr:Kinase protein [Thalictrum thalictroides]
MGPSSFYSENKWACSTTGDFLGDEGAKSIASTEREDENIYSTARLAPFSLKYYGRCLRKGSYTVKLHFAEIMLTADLSNNTRGKRIFDVYIQGDRVLTDFNIAEEAGGIRKAISVTPNFNPSTGLSAGAIAGIVVSSFVVVLLILSVLWKMGYICGDAEDKELRSLEMQTGYYTLTQIKAATGNFDIANKIGEGGFGPVYKGVLSDGSIIAVKQLSAKSKQGNREFPCTCTIWS